LPGTVVARPLRPTTFYLTASREYVRRCGMPNTPEDLAEHDLIAVGNLLDSLPRLTSKPGMSGSLREVLRYRSMDGVTNAISAGIGIAPVPATVFEDPLFKDVMVPILPDYPLQQATLYVVYTSRKFLPPTLRTFVDFIVSFISPASEPNPHLLQAPRPARRLPFTSTVEPRMRREALASLTAGANV
jgi:DNA-binding transcriptional LysR family regulator